MTAATYPADRKNSGYFARFAKALFRSDAVARIGADAVLLALFVAAEEDREHYRQPPQIWREQIMDRLQLRSPKRVLSVRSAAVEAGIVHYQPGTRTTPPTYWTLTPDWLDRHVPKRNAKTATRSETERETERVAERVAERFLTLLPSDPKKKSARTAAKDPKAKTFQPPTLEEVATYCRDRGNQVDAQAWLDHYQANGWRVGRNPMRDWQAAVRTWERNGVSRTNGHASQAGESIYRLLTPAANGRAQR